MARSGAAASAVVLLVTMALVQASMAAKYVVGGPMMWQLNSLHEPNFYQDWANTNKPFYTTDSLEFTWIDPDSVLQVDFAAFNACNTGSPIQAWLANPGGAPTTMLFPLRDYKFHTLYFISGYANNCLSGQKFFIDVNDQSSAGLGRLQCHAVEYEEFGSLGQCNAVFELT